MGLEEYVIGQHDVKVALAVGVHNHYKRVQFMVPKDGSESEVSDNNIKRKDLFYTREGLPLTAAFDTVCGVRMRLCAAGRVYPRRSRLADANHGEQGTASEGGSCGAECTAG
jgi:hypothetical protein